MNIMITSVVWDNNSLRDRSFANLPEMPILILDVPHVDDIETPGQVLPTEDFDDIVGSFLSDIYRWCHKGFTWCNAKDDVNLLDDVTQVLQFTV